MTFQDFRVGLRLLAKNPAYSLVSIGGLGVGLGVCLLLLSYARYCWHYNAHVPNANEVYIVKQRNNLELGTPWYDQAPLFLLDAARTAHGVTHATGFVTWMPLTVEQGGKLRRLGSLTVLPGFAEMLGLEATQGDLTEALTRPDAFAITEKAARRLFGTVDVLGRTLQLRLSAVDENRSLARIAAILRDPPPNTTIPFEILSGPNLSLVPPALHDELRGNSEWMGYLLIRVPSANWVPAVSKVLQEAFDAAPGTRKLAPEWMERLKGRHVRDIKLSPLRDAYFDREVATDWLSLPVDRGDVNVVVGLVAIAALILALAAINYINLATLRVVRRQREIALRKVLGVGSTRLALQFGAESLLISLLAAATGFTLAYIGQLAFSELMQRNLGSMLSIENIGIAAGLGVIVGLASAVYPAWIAIRVRPAMMLMGRPDSESDGSKRLRQALSILQVSTAMGLASVTLSLSFQARFAMDASPGFDPAALLVFDLPHGAMSGDEKPRGLMAALSQRAEIAGIAVSSDAVGRAQESWSTEIKREGGEASAIEVKSVSPNFFEQHGIRPAAGRLFDPKIDKESDPVPIVLNEIAARQLGFDSTQQALGQTLLFKSLESGVPAYAPKRIVGIAPEIRFNSLRHTPGAVAYELSRGAEVTLTLRASGSTVEAERAAREVWSGYYPNSVMDIRPAKEIYAANYADERRLAKLMQFSTAIAMFIAAIGIYVLATDTVQRRTKEIALRKLFGFRRRDIGILVAKQIGAVVAVSAGIALPLAALGIDHYLATYTERSPLAYWSLALAFGGTLAVAALAGARQAWVAVTIKPAVALRS